MAGAAGVLLAAAFSFGFPELALIGFAALGTLPSAGLWMLARPRLTVRREIQPLRVTAGEAAAAILTVTNRRSWRCTPITANEFVDGDPAGVMVPGLRGHETYRTGYPLPARRRGVYTVGPLIVEHTDPLRLMMVHRSYPADAKLFVHPVVDLIPPLPTGQGHHQDGPTSSLAPQGGIVFHSLREYLHGDDWRLVHWKSSARTGRLMVRHNTMPNEPRMMVVLDTSAPVYEDDEVFENAVRATASLCMAAIRAGFPLLLKTTAGPALAAGRDDRDRTAILDLLAAVHRDPTSPSLSALSESMPDSDAVSLAVVTGRPGPDDLGMLPWVRPRFQTVSLARFTRAAVAPARVPGVSSLSARDPAEFVAAWTGLVTR